jgi:hypothetical protein
MNSINDFNRAVTFLKNKGEKVLLLTTSTRWEGSDEDAKSTQLAMKMKDELGDLATLMHIPDLHIYQCEGNVSTEKGNTCGIKASVLKDTEKNPTGFHRCWASLNHKDDELWKVSKELFNSGSVIFFVSTRWGSANAVYQKLIERLNWIENRITTLNEDNIIAHINAGIIVTGHNWNVSNVVELQKQVFNFYGFRVPNDLSFHWQWTTDSTDETAEGYKKEPLDFKRKFGLVFDRVVESFKDWLKK